MRRRRQRREDELLPRTLLPPPLEAARVATAPPVGGPEVVVLRKRIMALNKFGTFRTLADIRIPCSGAARRSLRRDGEDDAAHSTTTGWIALSHELLHLVAVHTEGGAAHGASLDDQVKGRAGERILLPNTHKPLLRETET